jgi:hypothetical protein
MLESRTGPFARDFGRDMAVRGRDNFCLKFKTFCVLHISRKKFMDEVFRIFAALPKLDFEDDLAAKGSMISSIHHCQDLPIVFGENIVATSTAILQNQPLFEPSFLASP